MVLASSSMSFQDLFKKSILKLVPEQMDPLTLFLTMAVAFLVGLGIFMVYRKCFIGVVYDHSFNISLVIMTMLVAVIIVTISTNITLSLGMVGALSIVRYRTAVKNPLDLMFLFWSITSGIAIGAQYYYIAVITLVVVALALVFLRKMKDDEHLYVLIVNYDASMELEEEIRRKLADYRGKLRSKIVKNNITELTMEVHLKVENMNLTQLLSSMEGVHDVTLVQYRGTYEI
ncbi:MAG: DUF4956 domain-containing protein [Lachnospiraceae bacterium]|nr:DUF4956 domain-containing protein [Lachnospiraceae bacterium]MDD7078321.1 DUF4956 domain-containing protein [Lachnospiraceae bacterium]MDY3730936.1 DUF4956 domain-containing protein [Candidatus Choladocola sp.]